MTPGLDLVSAPRLRAAVTELEGLIRSRFPDARFGVGFGDDPEGGWLTAVVDVEDTDEVVDLVIDRLLKLQVDERLPISLLPVRPPERIAAALRGGGILPAQPAAATA